MLLSPVWLLVALAIRLDSPGPVLFRQERSGKRRTPFMVYKFRSMHNDAEAELETLRAQNEASRAALQDQEDPAAHARGPLHPPDQPGRTAAVHQRAARRDEPGRPRPGLPSEVAEYQEWQRQRLEVPPGITGLWQVSGRSELTFDEMVMLDIYYAENWSLGLDMRIMLRTVPQVLFGDGAY